MKKFWEEFKKFISKGNIIDLAIAFIIGNCFNKIVSSLVNDVIMPLISLAIGGADVSDWKWVIKPAKYDTAGNVLVAESALKYGAFIQTVIDFLIIALSLFVMFKIFNYSKNQLSKLGDNIVKETKKLKSKNKKKNKNTEENQVIEETAEVQETKETAEVQQSKETEQVENENETKAENSQKQEETPQSKEDVMVKLLTEIRDRLKEGN